MLIYRNFFVTFSLLGLLALLSCSSNADRIKQAETTRQVLQSEGKEYHVSLNVVEDHQIELSVATSQKFKSGGFTLRGTVTVDSSAAQVRLHPSVFAPPRDASVSQALSPARGDFTFVAPADEFDLVVGSEHFHVVLSRDSIEQVVRDTTTARPHVS
jgi:hypothetical protein